MSSPLADLLTAAIARDAAAPMITYYDDKTGERTELSGTSLANWVAKTANLLQDGLDVVPGDHLTVLLPPHWQTAVVLFAAWSLGAVVGADPEDADVLIVDEPNLAEFADADVRGILGLALRPMAGRLFDCPATVTDYAAEIAGYGDQFVPYTAVAPSAAAVTIDGQDVSGTALVVAAHTQATTNGLAARDRLLIDVDSVVDADSLSWLLAPLAAGASMVLCAHPDPAALPRRAETERCTASLGVAIDGLRRLGSG